MNPLDALMIGPGALRRALDDLHSIARFVRRIEAEEGAVLATVARLEGELDRVVTAVEAMRAHLVHLEAMRADLVHLEPMRRSLEPLERSMVSVRESVDDLEPMLADLDAKVRSIEPKLDELAESVEPIGELAEKFPGNRRRRHPG
jgi:predicted nuclease with TOPRIM domain